MNADTHSIAKASAMRVLSRAEIKEVAGGSYAFTVASSWASGVAGLGTGLIIGGIPGGIAGFAVGFSLSIISAGLYNAGRKAL